MKDRTGIVEAVGTTESAYSLTKARRPILEGVKYLAIAFLEAECDALLHPRLRYRPENYPVDELLASLCYRKRKSLFSITSFLNSYFFKYKYLFIFYSFSFVYYIFFIVVIKRLSACFSIL
jgi:hypothetical protein